MERGQLTALQVVAARTPGKRLRIKHENSSARDALLVGPCTREGRREEEAEYSLEAVFRAKPSEIALEA